MSIIFSKKCEYGIQAVLYLSAKGEGEVYNAEEISDHLKIPREFVSKILQQLTATGIVDSKKGKNGGFMLGKKSNKIKLLDVVLAIDGDSIFTNCVVGFPACSHTTPCPLHDEWGQLIQRTKEMLSNQTIDKFTMKTLKKLSTIK
ncbi:MAG: Rrf2 family transcriptional regulator [Ignavibacteriaceae bacterium]